MSIMLPGYKIPILMYHNIDEYSQLSKLSVSPKSFRKHIQFILKNKMMICSIFDAVNEENTHSKRKVCLTFDDGFKNNYFNAYPILREHEVPATIFVSTEHVGTPGFLTWRQIREMSDGGVIIGGHTKTHRWLPGLPHEEARQEIFDSKKIIEDNIGKKVQVFSYPLGGFNDDIIKVVKEAGYVCACATNPPKCYSERNRYTLRRIKVTRTSDNLFLFLLKISGYYTMFK